MECLYYFFPKHPADPKNNYEINLRKLIVLLLTGHVFSIIIGFALVGIGSGFTNILYVALLYSIYLSLRRWELLVYGIMLLINTACGYLTFLFKSGTALIGYFLILLFYTFSLYKLYKMESNLRKSGQSQRSDQEIYLEEGVKHLLHNAQDQYNEKVKKNPNQDPQNFTQNKQEKLRYDQDDEAYLDYYANMREEENKAQQKRQQQLQQQAKNDINKMQEDYSNAKKYYPVVKEGANLANQISNYFYANNNQNKPQNQQIQQQNLVQQDQNQYQQQQNNYNYQQQNYQQNNQYQSNQSNTGRLEMMERMYQDMKQQEQQKKINQYQNQ